MLHTIRRTGGNNSDFQNDLGKKKNEYFQLANNALSQIIGFSCYKIGKIS